MGDWTLIPEFHRSDFYHCGLFGPKSVPSQTFSALARTDEQCAAWCVESPTNAFDRFRSSCHDMRELAPMLARRLELVEGDALCFLLGGGIVVLRAEEISAPLERARQARDARHGQCTHVFGGEDAFFRISEPETFFYIPRLTILENLAAAQFEFQQWWYSGVTAEEQLLGHVAFWLMDQNGIPDNMESSSNMRVVHRLENDRKGLVAGVCATRGCLKSGLDNQPIVMGSAIEDKTDAIVTHGRGDMDSICNAAMRTFMKSFMLPAIQHLHVVPPDPRHRLTKRARDAP